MCLFSLISYTSSVLNSCFGFGFQIFILQQAKHNFAEHLITWWWWSWRDTLFSCEIFSFRTIVTQHFVPSSFYHLQVVLLQSCLVRCDNKKKNVIAAKVAKYRQPKKTHRTLPQTWRKDIYTSKVWRWIFIFLLFSRISDILCKTGTTLPTWCWQLFVCVLSGEHPVGGLHQQSAAASVQGKGFVELGRSLPDST